MSTRRAVVLQGKGVAKVRDNIPLPKLRDEYIIVTTKAVALNPADWKIIHDTHALAGGDIVNTISGCDYSGVVEEVGKAVTNELNVGDRVAGFIRGADWTNKDNGAFATTVTAKGDIQAKISDNISFEEAATFGVGITTVGQGLYQSLGLPLPPATVQELTFILIYGASTATGTLAVQFAKLSGLKVIATCSPHNFDLVKKLGADQVFDYKEPDIGAKIRKATNDKLTYVFDTIAEHSSPAISAAALSSKGGKYSSILKVSKFPRDDISPSFTLAYTALGEKYSDAVPKSKEDWNFGVKFWKLAADLINAGKIKAHPAEVREGGLDGITQGLQDLKEGKVSGAKLVYKI